MPTAFTDGLSHNGGKSSEAEAAFRAAIQLDPLYYEPFDYLWKILFRQNRIEEAEQLCRSRLSDTPNDARIYLALGYILSRGATFEAALEETKHSISRNPDYYLGYANAGGSLSS